MREEKLTANYAALVRQILEAVPGSRYLYAGKNRQPWFEALLPPDRVHFIGWVNTRMWVQVLDVYLDTFPFQSGHTVFEAMASSIPVVWLHDAAYATEQGVSGVIQPRWHGLYSADPIDTTAAGYIARAVALAQNSDARRRLGAANRTFFSHFMQDKRRMADSVSRALLDVIHSPRLQPR